MRSPEKSNPQSKDLASKKKMDPAGFEPTKSTGSDGKGTVWAIYGISGRYGKEGLRAPQTPFKAFSIPLLNNIRQSDNIIEGVSY